MAQVVTRMMASRGCSTFGSGTSSQRMSVGLCQTKAFIAVLLAVDAVNPPELGRVPPEHGFVRAPPGLAFIGGKAQLEGATQGWPRYAWPKRSSGGFCDGDEVERSRRAEGRPGTGAARNRRRRDRRDPLASRRGARAGA